MGAKLEFNLTLTQQIKLTPNLALSLELLQLPLLRLEELIKNEIEENPLIEPLDFVYESGGSYYEPLEEREETPVPKLISPEEVLLEQVRLELSGVEREVGKFIVENLDHRGLLKVPVEEVAKRFNLSPELVERVREKVKSFEPVGCGSLTLKEFIRSNLKELGAPKELLDSVEYLELLKEPDKFREITGLSEEQVKELLSLLKRIDLSPLSPALPPVPIKPDLKVYLNQKGEPVVEVNTPSFFKFKVNSYYLKYASREELKKYVTEKYQRALYLKRAIENRTQTLKRLAQLLFKRQIEFLKDGKTLKPLTITELARELSLHESTVSRAIKDKFVETPFGVFPLKSFFKKGIGGESVDDVKALIREIIESEDKTKPLSDSKIASLLEKRGIKIARRTVAKYREEMGIPGAYRRRKR
jgi:RNA polymerase sigma-54 factor